MWAWGRNTYGQIGVDSSETILTLPTLIMRDISLIETGSYTSFAIKRDGTVWGFGLNQFGNLGVSTIGDIVDSPVRIIEADNVRKIVGGDYQTYLMKDDGTVWICGDNSYGQLGTGDITNPYNSTEFIKLNGLTDAIDIACGSEYGMILLRDGSVWGCDINDCGQLGE